ncbi:hypothetical protein [Pandoraea apista]|uniref:hypothetical protein n=1 Tax=Pandoraea apista TaxID=93218 RepID=UPI000659C74B|nr:hypothetical protein [Pandoraea apista]RRJ28989.1 hypothetical protein EIB05_17590 [Pandoraea apista]RRJ73851.1 hypothetical protein EIL82_18340 [Pandoraea apista]RSD12585.1 hypothetical protein EIZ52_19950 [Pandoraea apista]RSK91172.1 hypothetical protein EJF22_14660 [Pandoraea apista]RUN81699.1 hypothetical protein EJ774_21470 [Pandoraea apista]
MRGFRTLRIATGWLVAGMLGFAGHACAQSGGALRAPVTACNCAQIVADCSASVSVIPTRAANGVFSADVMLQTDAPSCAKVDYQLDDTPYVTILRDGAQGGQRLYGTRPLTRNSLSHMSCHVCAAASAPVPNDGLSPDMARVDGAPGTFSAAPAAAVPPQSQSQPQPQPINASTYAPSAAASQNAAMAATAPASGTPLPSTIGDTAGLKAVNAANANSPEVARDVAAIEAPPPAGTTLVTPPIAPGAAVQASTPAPLRVVNPSGRWRGLCTNAPPWWGLWSSPMTRLMALALNGAQVTGSVDDVEPNIHTTVQGTLAGDRLQLAGSYGAKHNITFGPDGTTLTDAWCNSDGRCETCEMQRF